MAVAGIELPEGDPGAAHDAAAGLRRAGGGFERTGAVTARAVATVGSWQGMASFNFRDRCGDYGSAAAAASAACERAATALASYGHRLEEAREHVRRLQDRAQDCVDRIEAAERRAAEAGDRAEFAGRMAHQASMAAGADGGASAASLRAQADDARAQQQAALAEADRARDELERLRERARDERERVREAGRAAAGLVDAAAAELPTVSVAAPPPAPAADEQEEDKPWYEDAAGAIADGASWTGGQLLGVGKGLGEGVVGIGEGGYYLYRLSSFNQMVNPGDHMEAHDQLRQTASFAWNNPGEFGKAVVNWEDLSEGRYGEWLGNLGPDAAVAFFTAGSGTVATRGLRAADSLEDVGDAARAADRATDAAPVEPGTTVYRLHGYNEEPGGGLRLVEGQTFPDGSSFPSGAWGWGRSWTDVNPFDLTDPRAELGLPTGPDGNPARFLSIGELRDVTGVTRRDALPLDGNPGGAPELLIPDAQNQVELKEIRGLNPEP